ncbi:transglycosylase [Acinetobacter sp. NCu2D-2]|uniref:lytic transglycosylase domain-containing protein n=1 Tax=Acinetobacter sp. NCu2D-2 TaxID=1608473 RepID=UPI0007CDB99F|nr:transglycosylase SLT domain-containing protein [Acinetobacter sp. NCu2D-2]ANF81839.1 transglycosylase [Acinetobacter sp. NCu2D-2]
MPKFLKIGFCLSCSIAVTACSSLGMGSLEKKSAKLSQGIQQAYSVSPSTASRVSPMIIQSAEKQNLDPLLVAAVIRQESTYRSNATSPAGAVGLMQVMPRYWQNTCGPNLYDEWTNIQCGSYILSKYESSAGNIKKALAYYNVGPANYENNRKMRKIGKRYAKQVKQHQKALKSAL